MKWSVYFVCILCYVLYSASAPMNELRDSPVLAEHVQSRKSFVGTIAE